jgi:integrase/recombinase XerC
MGGPLAAHAFDETNALPRAGQTLSASDRFALSALESALLDARAAADTSPALVIVANAVAALGVRARPTEVALPDLRNARDAWLSRLRSAGRSGSTERAYRDTIDDFHAWLAESDHIKATFEERTVVAYLDSYRRRRTPAASTYHRHFVLLRCYVRWLARTEGRPDPFADLASPPRPNQTREWLTPPEFQRLLDAAGHPERRRAGLADRDRLVILALVTTGWRRSELIAIEWKDLQLDDDRPTGLVRRGKGQRPRPQPLPLPLADELRQLRAAHQPKPTNPVFLGLGGRRLQPGILASIISRCARRAAIDKHVTAHTLRHTAATWLRQSHVDTRLVAEFLGHADLSTVGRYAHVAEDELHVAAGLIAKRAMSRSEWVAE